MYAVLKSSAVDGVGVGGLPAGAVDPGDDKSTCGTIFIPLGTSQRGPAYDVLPVVNAATASGDNISNDVFVINFAM